MKHINIALMKTDEIDLRKTDRTRLRKIYRRNTYPYLSTSMRMIQTDTPHNICLHQC
jgi:hypothetical protein